jgi:hypothetical protein
MALKGPKSVNVALKKLFKVVASQFPKLLWRHRMFFPVNVLLGANNKINIIIQYRSNNLGQVLRIIRIVSI